MTYMVKLVKLEVLQLLQSPLMWTTEGLKYCSYINTLTKIWINIGRVTVEEAMIAANQMV